MKTEVPCPYACYGIQANFASVRFSGEFPVGKKMKLMCSGAIPGVDFKTYFPAMEFLPCEDNSGNFYTEIEFSNKTKDTQNIFSFRVMACPGESVEKKVRFFFESHEETQAEITLLRGSGFNDIETYSGIDLGAVRPGKPSNMNLTVKNNRDMPISITKAEFNSASMVCDIFEPIEILPGATADISLKYKNTGRYKTDELNLKLYYNVDFDEEEFVFVRVDSSFNTDMISDTSFTVKVMPYNDFDGVQITDSKLDLIYLGIGSGVAFNEERLVRIKLDNDGIRPVIVENIVYSSSNQFVEVETQNIADSTIEIPPGEAKTMIIKATNKGISGYGMGILSFTSRTIGGNIPASIKEIHKINFSWGKNG